MLDQVLFHSGQEENFYLLVLGQVQCIKLIQFCISYFHILINYYELTYLALKTVWILISWLLQKPADLDLHCFQKKPADQDPYCLQKLIYIWFHTVFERIICLSTERYKLFFFFRTSKIFYGHVHFGFLLAPGQVENFTIPTPLKYKNIGSVYGG